MKFLIIALFPEQGLEKLRTVVSETFGDNNPIFIAVDSMAETELAYRTCKSEMDHIGIVSVPLIKKSKYGADAFTGLKKLIDSAVASGVSQNL